MLMREVERACHGCLYGSDDDVYVVPENPGLSHLHNGPTEYTLTDDDCDLCGESPSLRKA